MDDRRVALVTGTSRGIGRGLVDRFLRDGYRVVGCSRGDAPEVSGDYVHACVDVTDEEAVHRWFADVRRSHDRIDVVVNNAGAVAIGPAALTPTATVEALLRVNFLGTFLVCREAAKLMVRHRYGRIINFASVACGAHTAGAAAYAASKSAVIEFSRILAKELAARDITVNVVAPSMVDTAMYGELSDDVASRYLEDLTIKRHCTHDEVEHVVSFFASQDAACVTGQVLYLGFAG
jgi:3-oxoacyl-[acyl-carrier protein] reductase